MFPDIIRDDVFRLETPRLWLRWPRLADAQTIVRLAGEKAVAKTTVRLPHPYTQRDAEDFILDARLRNADGSALHLAITPKGKPNSLLGMVGIRPAAKPHLGYWIGEPFWGQGYATEAVQNFIDAFFLYTGEALLTAHTLVTNEVSRRVLEKCGFTLASSDLVVMEDRGRKFSGYDYRLPREAWSAVKPWERMSLEQMASAPLSG